MTFHGFDSTIIQRTPAIDSSANSCTKPRAVRPAVHVAADNLSFPSFLKYKGAPMNVSYDCQSIVINGDHVLLLGGSIHPVCATKQSWELVLDEAVHQGLNLITIYVIWAAHQPTKDNPLNWTLQHNVLCQTDNNCDDAEGILHNCDWELADVIWSMASHGLFVHIWLGPYLCVH
jgi:hypothetical protein